MKNGKLIKCFAALLLARHGGRCKDALAGVFAKQKLQQITVASLLLLFATCGTSSQAGGTGAGTDAPVGILHVGHDEKIREQIFYSPDGGRYATIVNGSSDVRIWDTQTDAFLLSFRRPTVRYEDSIKVKWSRDGREIMVQVKGVDNTGAHRDYSSYYSTITGLEVSQGNFKSASAGKPKVKINEDRRDSLTRKKPARIGCISWSQDGRRLLTTVRDEEDRVYVWDTAAAGVDSASPIELQFTDEERLNFGANLGGMDVRSMAQKSDGTIALGLGTNGWLQTYNAGQVVSSFSTGQKIEKLVYSPNGRQLLLLRNGNNVEIWDPSGRRTLSLTWEGGCNDIAWSPDGSLVAASGGGGVKVWNASTGAQVMSFNDVDIRYYTVDCFAFTPNGKQLLIGDRVAYDKKRNPAVKLLDAQTGRVVRTFGEMEGERVSAVAMTPDSKQVIAVFVSSHTSISDSIKVWDAESGAEIKTINNNGLSIVAISPDATRVAIRPDATSVYFRNNPITVIHIPSGKSASLAIYAPDEWAAVANEGVSLNSSERGARNIAISSGGIMLPRESYAAMNDPALLRAILTGTNEFSFETIGGRETLQAVQAAKAQASAELTAKEQAATVRVVPRGNYGFKDTEVKGAGRYMYISRIEVGRQNFTIPVGGKDYYDKPGVTSGVLTNVDTGQTFKLTLDSFHTTNSETRTFLISSEPLIGNRFVFSANGGTTGEFRLVDPGEL